MKKFLTLILSSMLLVSAVNLVGCSTVPNPQEQSTSYVVVANVTMAGPPTVVGDYLQQRIESTIKPDNAVNKKVTYSVAWEDLTKTSNVAEYITVVQDSDGSLGAVVNCYKPFEGGIIITATAVDGGAKGYCRATYLGIASSLTLSNSSLSVVNNSNKGSIYCLGTGRDYSFDINLTNLFKTTPQSNLSVEISSYGSVVLADGYQSSMGGDFYGSKCYTKSLSEISDKFISAKIENGKLILTTSSTSFSNFYMKRQISTGSGSSYYDYTGRIMSSMLEGDGQIGTKDYSYWQNLGDTSLNSCYFVATVSDSLSGKSDSFRFWIEPSVSSVSLSESEIQF